MAEQGHWPAGQAAAEWRAGWPLVAVSTIGYSVVGMSTYSLSAFLVPLQTEFGWDRSLLTAGMTVYAATSLFCQPLVGWMVDRFGPRRIALLGVIGSAITFAMFGATTSSPISWLALWLLYSLSVQLMLTPVWSTAVASEFEASRGLALAVMLAGSAISGAAAPIAATVLIELYGWRIAYAVIGLGVGALVLVGSFFWFHSRADRARGGGKASAETAALAGVTLAESLRSAVFYKLLFAIFSGYVIGVALLVHMIPVLVDSGLTRTQAAGIAAIFGIANVIGKILCGALVSRFPGHYIAAVVIALPLVTFSILLMQTPPIALLALAIALVGASVGSQLSMAVYLTTRYFGMRAFAAIFGFLGISLTIAGGFGPLLGGFMYDYFGDYRLFLMLGIPAAAIGTLLMLWVGDYPEVREARRLAKAAA